METGNVALHVPARLYEEIEALAAEEHAEPVEVIARLVTRARRDRGEPESDPVLGLIGAYHSRKPLIDGIPVSEDPDLYMVAAAMGDAASALHAWDIAPQRYVRGENGQPVRRSQLSE